MAEQESIDTNVIPSVTKRDTNVLPSDTKVLPNDTKVLPNDTKVLPSDTKVLPSDTNVLPSDTNVLPSDTNLLPRFKNVMPSDNMNDTNVLAISDTALFTNVLPSVTNVLPSVTKSDTKVLPSDTKVLPNDTKVLPNDTKVLPSDTKVLPSDTVELPPIQPLGQVKQYGNLRLYGNDIELFERLAEKLDIKPYTLMYRIVGDFIKNPQAKIPINEDLIRKDESAKCAERTEMLMKTFMPVASHQSEVEQLTDLYAVDLKTAQANLDKVSKELANIKASEEFNILINNLEMVRQVMAFLTELNLQSNPVNPISYITFYNNLRAKYKNLKAGMAEKHEAELEALSQKMKYGFVEILKELVDNHVQYPFISGQGIFDVAYQQTNNL